MNNFNGSSFLMEMIFTLPLILNGTMGDPQLSENMINQKTVKDKIMTGYDRFIRPTKEGSNTTEVSTWFMPRQILELDEDNGIFTMDSYFAMAWEDPRLKWNSTTEYNGYLQLPHDQLWVPDLTVHNSHSLQVDPTQQVLLSIAPTGNVIWVPPILTQTSCEAIIAATYPNDEVDCVIQLGSWTHDGWEIDFAHEEHFYMGWFVNIHPRWELVTDKAKMVRNVTYFEGYNEPYLSLHVHFPMKRRPLPEIEATRNPCILVILLTLSIFWLPPDSSKKVLLGGFLFLALTLMLVYVSFSTKFPLGVLFAVSFLQSTMYILVVTILLQVLVIFNLCNLSGPFRPPPAVMQLLTGPLGKYACLRSPLNHNLPIDRLQLKEDASNTVNSPTPKEDWLLFAAGLDRLFFVLTSIAMIAVHHL